MDQAIYGNSDNEGDVEPVDMLVPIGTGNRFLSDMWLLWIELLVTIWLRRLCHWRWLLQSSLCGRRHGDVLADGINE